MSTTRCVALVLALLMLLGCPGPGSGTEPISEAPPTSGPPDAPPPAPPSWMSLHGLDGQGFDAAHAELSATGHRLEQLVGYTSNGSVGYVARWRLASGPEQRVIRGVSAAGYQASFDVNAADGFRLVSVEAWSAGGGEQFAAIWEAGSAVGMAARHGLSEVAFQETFDELGGQGYRLVHVTGYAVGGAAHYAGIWEKTGGPAWSARHGMTAASFQTEFDQRAAQGYHPTVVSGYRVAGTDRYVAIWQKGPASCLQARHGTPEAWHQAVFDHFVYQAYEPAWVHAFDGGGGARFNTVWTNATFACSDLATAGGLADGYLQEHGAPGVAIAIAKDGRLVWAGGFGTGDQATGEPVGPRSRFRVASVSKPLTSIAIMRLVERGELSLDSRVFGAAGLLGSRFSTPSGEERLEQITVRQLLQHTSGLSKVAGKDPMFQHTGWDVDQLIGWALANQIGAYEPGTMYEYSNFGFCLLGRIIEEVTGKSYEQAVRDEVFVPAGALGVRIGRNQKSKRHPGEVVYHPSSAYSLNVTRFDAHGGWVASPIELLRVLVRADGATGVPDLLASSSHSIMTTASGVPNVDGNASNYALGWAVGQGLQEHNGAMPGTAAQLVRWTDGWSYAAVVNQRPGTDVWVNDLSSTVREIINGIQAWPSHDLF